MLCRAAVYTRAGCTEHLAGPPVLGRHLLHLADDAARDASLSWLVLEEDLLVQPQELHVGLLMRVQQEQGLPSTAHAGSAATAMDKGTATRNKDSLSKCISHDCHMAVT